MKRTKYCVAVLFVSMIANISQARAACSNAIIKGTYGILSTGLDGSLQPASSLDQITVDGNGNVSGTSTKSLDGTIVTYTVSGTYSISSNCTGTAIFNNQNGDTEHDNIFLNNANMSSGLYAGGFLIQTDSSHVQSSIAVAQGTATCTNLGVKHPYSFEATGLNIGTGQVAAAGRLTLNGTGSISGTVTVSLNGSVGSSLTATGTYQINSNCTGTAQITPKGLSASNFASVVVNGGKEIMAVGTDANTIITGTFQE